MCYILGVMSGRYNVSDFSVSLDVASSMSVRRYLAKPEICSLDRHSVSCCIRDACTYLAPRINDVEKSAGALLQ